MSKYVAYQIISGEGCVEWDFDPNHFQCALSYALSCQSLNWTQILKQRWLAVKFYRMSLWVNFSRSSVSTFEDLFSIPSKFPFHHLAMSSMSVRISLSSSVTRGGILMDLGPNTCFIKRYICLVVFELAAICISSAFSNHHFSCRDLNSKLFFCFCSFNHLAQFTLLLIWQPFSQHRTS